MTNLNKLYRHSKVTRTINLVARSLFHDPMTIGRLPLQVVGKIQEVKRIMVVWKMMMMRKTLNGSISILKRT